jgi:hypothetical protein
MPLLLLGLSLGLAGCGSGGGKGEGLLGDPAPPTVTSSSSGSTSSSGLPAGTLIDPKTNILIKVSLVAEEGAISYGETRKITLTFTDSKGAGVDPTFAISSSSNCITNKKASISDPRLENNIASFVYTSLGCLGDDYVNFALNSAGSEFGRVKIVTKGETVAFITEVGKPVPSKIYLGGDGTPKSSEITFKVTGQSSQPLAGQIIEFTNIGAAGGLTIVPSSATSDKDGIVKTVVNAGNVPTLASIQALHRESGKKGTSSSLDVSSSLPSDRKFTLSADAYTLRAYSIVGEEKTSIQATLLDTAGNPVPDGTVVKFVSNEQGQVDSSCPTKNGACSVQFIPNGRQPADGRVQLLAYTQGSEYFIDNNANKIFDDGDTFDLATMDLGEPYSDDNDNGKYDIGEFYINTNSNGARDEPDGKWNGFNCKHSSLCAKDPSQLVAISQQLTLNLATGNVSICEPGDFAGNLWVKPKETISLGGMYLSDGNKNAKNDQGHGCLTGNSLPNGTKIEFSASAGTIKNSEFETIADNSVYPNGPYGILFTASDKAGVELIKLKVTQPARGSLGEKVTTISIPIAVSEIQPDAGPVDPNPSTAGSFLDPSLNQLLVADITADLGIVSYGIPRDINLSFKSEAGIPQVTTSQISASSACISSGRAQISQPTVSDNNVKFIYTPKGCVGDDVVSFSATASGKTVTVGTYKLVTAGENVGSILFISASPTQIPISTDGPNSGGLSIVTFKVVGPSGAGVAGEQVEFKIDGTAGGVTLVNLTDISDSQGLVRAQVRSGTTPNNVTVIASHAKSNATKRSEGLTVASGLALKGNFTLALDVFNPNAYSILSATDLVNVSVAVRDASGNAVIDGTVVNFTIPEAGIVSASCQTVKGVCSVGWKPTGKQPADGRVRMAAIVKASEHFSDKNGNLIFDDGDVFDLDSDDLDEPYVDLDEDGEYQVGEPFTDSNLNGARDLADGKWNGLNCQHTSLCGSSKSVDLQESTVFHLSSLTPTICSAGNFGPSGTTLTVVAGETLSLSGLMFSDGNSAAINSGAVCATGNSLPNGTTISSKVSGGSIVAGGEFLVRSNELYPNGSYYLLYKAPTTAGTEALTITVGGVQFYWPIKVTAPPVVTP